ncbi:MAG TPA: hypothetical protein VL688_12670 [Verrucomicrobiae bacterium]|nr:hypothetical protein [Verrucomicrobiae bacterium]
MENENQPVSKLYKEMMTRDLREVDLAEEKRLFIARHFEEAPAFVFRPELLVPAGAFAFCALLLMRVWPLSAPLPAAPEQTARVAAEQASAAAPAAEAVPAEDPMAHRVSVERVSSDTGIPVVFQKTIDNSPVTIIWVIPRTDIVQGG